MKLLDRLERSVGRFAIPRITIYIIALQTLAYLLSMAAEGRGGGQEAEFLSRLDLIGSLVLQGQVWRIFTFVAVPPLTNPIFFFFAMYMLYLMGTALENHWGTFRYNVFLLIGWLAAVAVSLALPAGTATNIYLTGSVFLAFAFLYPDFQILLFFIFPVKVKWLALLTWIGYFISFCLGDWLGKALVLAATANFLLFFHEELWARARGGHRRMLARAKTVVPLDHVFNRCTTCGVTEKSDPRMEFRYCAQCAGTLCYCLQHIQTHQHVAPQK
jgi:membrane associated rhomboid family serine protease